MTKFLPVTDLVHANNWYKFQEGGFSRAVSSNGHKIGVFRESQNSGTFRPPTNEVSI